jgi:DNA-binding Lrp family transcriptional regulator
MRMVGAPVFSRGCRCRSVATRADEGNDDFAERLDNSDETSDHFAVMTKDQLDRDLLALLQANARESTANLARRLGIARTTVVARLARLERDGVVVGYTARLGVDERRPRVMAHVGITHEPKRGRDVLRRLQKIPELLQLYSVSGEFDYLAVLRAESTERLDALLDEIGMIDGVLRTTTSVVLAVRIDRAG